MSWHTLSSIFSAVALLRSARAYLTDITPKSIALSVYFILRNIVQQAVYQFHLFGIVRQLFTQQLLGYLYRELGDLCTYVAHGSLAFAFYLQTSLRE